MIYYRHEERSQQRRYLNDRYVFLLSHTKNRDKKLIRTSRQYLFKILFAPVPVTKN